MNYKVQNTACVRFFAKADFAKQSSLRLGTHALRISYHPGHTLYFVISTYQAFYLESGIANAHETEDF